MVLDLRKNINIHYKIKYENTEKYVFEKKGYYTHIKKIILIFHDCLVSGLPHTQDNSV